MVIQRWQSVFLLLAAIFLGVSFFTPVAEVTIADKVMSVAAIDSIVSIVIGLVSTILTLLSIFLYKNIGQQIKTTIIAMLLSVAYGASSYIIACNMEDTMVYKYGGVYVALAIVLQINAVLRMRSDERKLKSYDRIR